MHYVNLVASEPDAIDPSVFDDLRQYYSDADLAELTMFLTFNLGLHTFFGSLNFYPMYAPDGRLVGQDESARLYGDAPISLQGETGPARAGDAD